MSDAKRVSLSSSSLNGAASTTQSSKDAKRVSLLQSEPFGHPSPATFNSETSKNRSAPSKRTATTRLVLELFKPNSDSFPEYNFTNLLYVEKKKQKKLKQKSNGFPSSLDNDEDLAGIARELEKKYGKAYKSRASNRKDDFCDIGLGYDESDSFIDNTDAYDEVIPEEVETVEGGFYINSGALEFKRMSSYEKTDEIIKIPQSKKRALSSSSEDSSDESESESSSKAKNVSKPKPAGPVEKKVKTVEGKDKEKPKRPEKVEEKTVKTTTVKDMLKAKRDQFLKMQEEEGKPKGASSSSSEVKSSVEESEDSDALDEDEDSADGVPEKKPKKGKEEDSEKLRNSDVTLPSSLSADLRSHINFMLETAKNAIRAGKPFEFDDTISEKFSRIDLLCQGIDKQERSLVFAHLEYNLKLPKYFLLRKAKQIRIKDEKAKTRKAFIKLKKRIEADMVPLLKKYNSKMQKYKDIKESGDPKVAENLPKLPKMKFMWTDLNRNLLCELHEVRKSSFDALHTRKDTLTDFVDNYLQEKVVALWPAGWMKYADLKKELQNSPAKPAVLPSKAKSPLVDETSNSSSTSSSATSNERDKPAEVPPSQPPVSSSEKTSTEVVDLATTPVKTTDHSISSLLSSAPAHISPKTAQHVNGSAEKSSKAKATEVDSASSDSDCVEIVGVFPATPQSLSSKVKAIKSSSSGSSSHSPSGGAGYKAIKSPSPSAVKSEQKEDAAGGGKEPGFDVNEVMKTLRELEEMQHVGANCNSSSSSTAAINQTSPVYNNIKDVRQ